LVDVSVNLDPLTVLIGRSGTGKSNFVHAIRFLQDCLLARSINFDQRDGIDRNGHLEHGDGSLGFEVLFLVPNLDDEFRYILRRLQGGEIEESLKVGERVVFHHSHGKWNVPPGEPPHPGAGGIRLGALPSMQESTFAYRALTSGIARYEFPSDVLTRGGTDSDPPDRGLTERAENYLLVAERIFSEPSTAPKWKSLSRVTKAVNRSISDLVLFLPDVRRMDVRHQWNGRTHSLDVRQESEGFRRFLAHMLALYQTPPKQTLIFEHPESGLHPGALESLACEFKDCPEDGRGQVILTTHSPQLLDYFPAEAIRVVDIKDHVTRIGPLAPEQSESLHESLLHPGELLTVDPARLPGQLDEVPG
jgi:predicted ATPase